MNTQLSNAPPLTEGKKRVRVRSWVEKPGESAGEVAALTTQKVRVSTWGIPGRPVDKRRCVPFGIFLEKPLIFGFPGTIMYKRQNFR